MRIPGFLLNQKATIKDYEGDGMYGPEYGDPYEVKCRAEFGNELVRARDGDEVVSSVRFFFRPDVQPPPESLIEYDGQEYEVIQSMHQHGLNKPSHTEVTAR